MKFGDRSPNLYRAHRHGLLGAVSICPQLLLPECRSGIMVAVVDAVSGRLAE
jgi:hypothetical protein